ncbi:predicted protein [Enterococcus faecium 1,231,501]|nr:predicted protein [Enterococcus faecium 1,231,501]
MVESGSLIATMVVKKRRKLFQFNEKFASHFNYWCLFFIQSRVKCPLLTILG